MPIVQAEKVSKVYREGRALQGQGPAEVVAVEEASLAVEPGEIVAIVGPSGSGKTTFLSMLGCILRPTAGRIILAGRDITDLDENELPLLRRRYIGFIFQTFNLFSSLTAQENVEVALNLKGIRGKAAQAAAFRLLERFGLAPRAHHLPRDLSGGEKQRVSVARAMAGDPPLILADEPTANLDWKSGQRIMESLGKAAREDGRSVVVVTHDSRIEALANRVLYMEDGRIRDGVQP